MTLDPRLHDYQVRAVQHLHTDRPLDRGYRHAHASLRRERGPAKDHACIGCGEQAADWAYQYTAEDERWCIRLRRPYHPDLQHYKAMCRSCHVSFDLAMDEGLAERRAAGARRTGSRAKTAEHVAAVWLSRRANTATMESFSGAMSETATKTNSKRVRCEECGYENNPGNLGWHRKKTGHRSPKKGE